MPCTVVSTPGGEQGADHQRRLFVGDVAAVGGGPDLRAEPVVGQDARARTGRSPTPTAPARAGAPFATRSLGGPKALKARSPYGSRFSRPSCGRPTASGNTRSGNASASAGTASNSSAGRRAGEHLRRRGRRRPRATARAAGAATAGRGSSAAPGAGRRGAAGRPRAAGSAGATASRGGSWPGPPRRRTGSPASRPARRAPARSGPSRRRRSGSGTRAGRPRAARPAAERVLEDVVGERVGVVGGQRAARSAVHRSSAGSGRVTRCQRSRTRRSVQERDTHRNMQSPAARSSSSSSESRWSGQPGEHRGLAGAAGALPAGRQHLDARGVHGVEHRDLRGDGDGASGAGQLDLERAVAHRRGPCSAAANRSVRRAYRGQRAHAASMAASSGPGRSSRPWRPVAVRPGTPRAAAARARPAG